MDFCDLQENYLTDTYRKQLLDTDIKKTGIDAPKTASKKVVHKIVEATRELMGNKIAEKNCTNKRCDWSKFEKCSKNSYSTREKTRDIQVL